MRSHEFSQNYHSKGLEYTSYQEDIQKIPSPLSQAVSSLKDKIRGVLQWTKKTLRPQVAAVQEEPVVAEETAMQEIQAVSEEREDTTISSIPLFVRTAPYVEVKKNDRPTLSGEEIDMYKDMSQMHNEIRDRLLPDLARQTGYDYEKLANRYWELLIEYPGDPRIAFNVLRRAVSHSYKKGNKQFIDTSLIN